MNPKYLAILLMIFGLLFTLAQCGRLTVRNQGDTDDDGDGDDGDDAGDGNDGNDADDDDNDALEQEKRAILNFLQDGNDASKFLDPSRRLLFSSQKSHMKDAKKKYEESCERLLQPRYCPDLATWPAWNQAFNAATKKK